MPNSRRILIVEDDAALRKTLVEQLADEYGFLPVEAASLAEAAIALANEQAHIDAVILDVGLPDGDGFRYCAELREAGLGIPIIFLTGLAEDADIVHGLSFGANDYIAKPFRVAELVARLQAQFRSFDSSEDATFSIGPYVFQPAKKILRHTHNSHVVRLTGLEVMVLKFLYRANAGVDRQALLDQVWGYNAGVTTNTVETHIYRLRQKIEADPASPTLLITVDTGYRLVRDSASQ